MNDFDNKEYKVIFGKMGVLCNARTNYFICLLLVEIQDVRGRWA